MVSQAVFLTSFVASSLTPISMFFHRMLPKSCSFLDPLLLRTNQFFFSIQPFLTSCNASYAFSSYIPLPIGGFFSLLGTILWLKDEITNEYPSFLNKFSPEIIDTFSGITMLVFIAINSITNLIYCFYQPTLIFAVLCALNVIGIVGMLKITDRSEHSDHFVQNHAF